MKVRDYSVVIPDPKFKQGYKSKTIADVIDPVRKTPYVLKGRNTIPDPKRQPKIEKTTNVSIPVKKTVKPSEDETKVRVAKVREKKVTVPKCIVVDNDPGKNAEPLNGLGPLITKSKSKKEKVAAPPVPVTPEPPPVFPVGSREWRKQQFIMNNFV